MRASPPDRKDASVVLLVAAFTITAIGVFGVALYRHRSRTANEGPLPQAPLPDTDSPQEDGTAFRVCRIVDGDTLTVKGRDRIEIIIRLAGIDAPELDQPYGLQAKSALAEEVEGQEVNVRVFKRGKYGRYVGDVSVAGRCINLQLVQRGYAWAASGSRSNGGLLAAQETAKHANRGLWQDANPTPPWTWREQRK